MIIFCRLNHAPLAYVARKLGEQITTFQHSIECWNVVMLYGKGYNFFNVKTPKQLERYFKGAANHWRIAILLAVEKNEGIAVEEIAEELDADFKNISQHTRRLVQAGLLNKKYRGRQVAHTLSPYGKSFLKFMRTF